MTNTTTRRPPRATRQPRTLFPGDRRFNLRLACILETKRLRVLALATSLLLGACRATVPAAVEVETVGALAPSYHSVAVAPVHKSTDLGIAYQAAGDDDDVAAAAPAPELVETPDVAPKAGFVMGTVR